MTQDKVIDWIILNVDDWHLGYIRGCIRTDDTQYLGDRTRTYCYSRGVIDTLYTVPSKNRGDYCFSTRKLLVETLIKYVEEELLDDELL